MSEDDLTGMHASYCFGGKQSTLFAVFILLCPRNGSVAFSPPPPTPSHLLPTSFPPLHSLTLIMATPFKDPLFLEWVGKYSDRGLCATVDGKVFGDKEAGRVAIKKAEEKEARKSDSWLPAGAFQPPSRPIAEWKNKIDDVRKESKRAINFFIERGKTLGSGDCPLSGGSGLKLICWRKPRS